MTDADYMKRALRLAVRGKAFVSPNPMVGCVIVKDGQIIGEGFHQQYGESHAEIVALNSCEIDPIGATVYVNLQPCCHKGKTDACTYALINAGVSKVIYASKDTNPLVAGKADGLLLDAGIEVASGVMQDEADLLNRKFLYWKKTGKPWITLKVAASLDGKIAMKSGESKYITSAEARSFVHELRAEHDAVLVGSGTLKADDPNLGLHGARGREPFRFVLGSSVDKDDADVFRDSNCAVVSDIDELFDVCAEREISSILVEGGSFTFTSFFKSNHVNELVHFIAYKVFGNDHLPAFDEIGLSTLAQVKEFTLVESMQFEGCTAFRFLL